MGKNLIWLLDVGWILVPLSDLTFKWVDEQTIHCNSSIFSAIIKAGNINFWNHQHMDGI